MTTETAPTETVPFDEPWQAQLFALTVALSEAGHFSWPAWTEAFGAVLKDHGAARPLDGQGDYWNAWLVTLEGMLDRAGSAVRDEVESVRARWEHAYLSTPHGKPVRIDA
jgi:nitrile hydratase accessory protein